MGGRIPSLDVIRPVSNITPEDMAYVERDLQARNAFAANKIHDLFVDGVDFPLQAVLAGRQELMRLQRAIGEKDIDKNHIAKLSNHIQGKLPPVSREAVGAPTRPVKLLENSEIRRARLTIAGSPGLIQERALVLAAICDFYDIERIPETVRQDDEYSTRTRFIRAKRAFGVGMLRQLEDVLSSPEIHLLPEETVFGPVEIKVSD